MLHKFDRQGNDNPISVRGCHLKSVFLGFNFGSKHKLSSSCCVNAEQIRPIIEENHHIKDHLYTF